MAFEDDLPDELQSDSSDSARPDEVTREQRLDALGIAVAEKRDEAIKGREESGIEKVWIDAEEAYLCVDEANRGDFAKAKWAKPTSMSGPLTQEKSPSQDNPKSTVFVRVTPRYVDAGYAKICEIILPIDDKAFSIGPTPNPDLVLAQDDLTQLIHNGTPLMRKAKPEELTAMSREQQPQPGQPVPQVPLTVADLVKEQMDLAAGKAEKAETRIYDWMVESKYPSQMRKVIFDSARIGVGVLKGPYPSQKRSQAIVKLKGKIALEIKNKVFPGCKWVDPWNCFPDPECGEDIDDGDYFFERDYMTVGKLKKLKKQTDAVGAPIYLNDRIDKVLKEGPGKINVASDSEGPNQKRSDKRFQIWYMTGTLTREDMEAAGAVGLEDLPDDVVEAHAIVTMVNDTVIRVTVNPLESGKFGYHPLPWSRRAGHWAGVGVAEQVTMPQRTVNASTRALLNNAGLSAGVQIILDKDSITPADNKWTITPNKLWFKAAGVTMDDVRKAFNILEIPNVGAQLMDIINLGFRLAEEACNIPLVSQGQVNSDTPDTFGALELQNSNANTLLRSIAMNVDDHITEPVVSEYYEYLLLDPNVPDDEKGDFDINARGSVAMVEKAIQEKTLMQMLGVALNPAYGADPKRVFAELLKTKRIDPRKVQYTEQEIQEQQSKPAAPPIQVQVEQLRGQNALALQNQKTQGDLAVSQQELSHEQQMLQSGGATPHQATAMARIEVAKIQAESRESVEANRSQAELAYAETERAMAHDNAQARHMERQDMLQLEVIKYANQQRMSLEQVRADLAKTAMQETTKRQLASATLAVQQSEGAQNRAASGSKPVDAGPEVAKPAAEPAQKAPEGQAFSA